MKVRVVLSMVMLCVQPSVLVYAQSNTILKQVANAFAGSQTVQQVQISGSATWHAGSLEDSGTATLLVSPDGSSQVQLVLSSSGTRTESQTGAGESAQCLWSGADGVAHQADTKNCWKPLLWFLPTLSLQAQPLPSYLVMVDGGPGTVGTGTAVYRHLQSHLVFADFPGKTAVDIAKQSLTDLGLDPATLLPAVLSYAVHPDNGNSASVNIEIRYSDYRQVSGVQIPFRIQRYLNGSLQLDIQASSVQIN